MIEHGPIGLSHLNILTHIRLTKDSEFRELLSRQSHGINSIRRRLTVDVSKRVLSGSVLFGLFGSLRNGVVGHVDSCLSCPDSMASVLQKTCFQEQNATQQIGYIYLDIETAQKA